LRSLSGFDVEEFLLRLAISGGAPRLQGLSDAPASDRSVRRAARRELQWFYTRLGGRVPISFYARPENVAAARTIRGWLSDLDRSSREILRLRYDRRRWPARLVRELGGFTCVVARFAKARGAKRRETLDELERRAEKELLPADVATFRRLRRSALSCASVAETEYAAVRGFRPCVVPSCTEDA
jgi:hypothetical protein